MVRMGTIWDRTVEVLRGRAGMLAGIAALTIYLPDVVQAAFRAYALGNAGLVALGGLFSIVVLVLALFGALALVAVASDPDVTSQEAYARAGRRLPAMVGLTVLLILALLVIASPGFVLIAASGIDFAAVANGARPAPTSPGMVVAAVLYFLAVALIALFFAARLALLTPVILHERLGIGAFRRSFALTGGLTWRLIGVLILFFIVVAISAGAVNLVAGLVFRLVLGSGGQATALFLAGALSSIVTAGWSVVQSVFVAQLYTALTGREAAAAFA